jgi:hypothetical protein
MSAILLEMSLQAEEKFFTQSQAHIWKSELPRSRWAFVYLCEGAVSARLDRSFYFHYGQSTEITDQH